MSALSFYDMMGYPLPLRSEFFQYQETYTGILRPMQDFWSWLHPPSDQMKEYIAYVSKWQRIWRYIPGVVSVYIANSMSFNALQEQSNIDLFVVTRKNRLWTTKFLIDGVLQIMYMFSRRKIRTKRFDVDFLVTEDMQDISRLLLTPSDPYLVYWLVHLVPIYYYDYKCYDMIYEHNSRLTYYLPNFAGRQSIFLGIDILIADSWIKRWGERCMGSIVGGIGELLFLFCYRVFFRWKIWRAPSYALRLLYATGIYKVYDDKRRRYALQRELLKKTQKV